MKIGASKLIVHFELNLILLNKKSILEFQMKLTRQRNKLLTGMYVALKMTSESENIFYLPHVHVRIFSNFMFFKTLD